MRSMRKEAESSRGASTETAALSVGCHPDVRALVCCLSAELATSGRNDVGTRNRGRSFDSAPLGDEAIAGTGEGISPPQTHGG